VSMAGRSSVQCARRTSESKKSVKRCSLRIQVLRTLAFVLVSAAAIPCQAQDKVTILYDAFGESKELTKDWGFSAFVEHNGKRILFDTGNDATIFEHNSTSGRTLVESLIELAYKYQVPMAIEYADWEATKRPLNLEFHNKSLREIVEGIVKEDPKYRVSFSSGIVDIFSPMARQDSSNLLNKIMKDFSVTELETRLADYQLFCAVVVQAAGSGGCAGSLAVGQWDPLRITLHMHNARVYEILNAIVAQNGRAIWTVTASNLASVPQCCGLWYIYPLEGPFKSVASDRLVRMPQ